MDCRRCGKPIHTKALQEAKYGKVYTQYAIGEMKRVFTNVRMNNEPSTIYCGAGVPNKKFEQIRKGYFEVLLKMAADEIDSSPNDIHFNDSGLNQEYLLYDSESDSHGPASSSNPEANDSGPEANDSDPEANDSDPQANDSDHESGPEYKRYEKMIENMNEKLNDNSITKNDIDNALENVFEVAECFNNMMEEKYQSSEEFTLLGIYLYSDQGDDEYTLYYGKKRGKKVLRCIPGIDMIEFRVLNRKIIEEFTENGTLRLPFYKKTMYGPHGVSGHEP